VEIQHLTNPGPRRVAPSNECRTPAFGVSGEGHVLPLSFHAGDDGAEPIPRIQPGAERRQRVGVEPEPCGFQRDEEQTGTAIGQCRRSPAPTHSQLRQPLSSVRHFMEPCQQKNNPVYSMHGPRP
jgi:hypothetical protein